MFKIGDRVTFKKDFTVGVGTVVESSPHILLPTGEVDVQWPKKRRFEKVENLKIALGFDFVAPCPICGDEPRVSRASMGLKLYDGYVVECSKDMENGWHDLRADLDHWNSMFKPDLNNPLVKFANAETEIISL